MRQLGTDAWLPSPQIGQAGTVTHALGTHSRYNTPKMKGREQKGGLRVLGEQLGVGREEPAQQPWT